MSNNLTIKSMASAQSGPGAASTLPPISGGTKYRPEIDGLRAVAVLPVILFHAGITPFSGGFVGVDIFFVISGYLITGIIMAELERGAFSISRFYERRARRILPALILVVIACVPFAWFWMLPTQFSDFSKSVVSVSLFVSNIFFWKQSGYFAPSSEEAPLLHTWSLSVEEQFYIGFPLFLMLLMKVTNRRNIILALAALSALSLILAEWGWRNAPTANFYLIPFRSWELGIGALCQMIPVTQREQRYGGVLALLGLIGALFSIFAYSDATPFPSLYALLPVGGAAFLLRYGSSTTITGQFLAFKPLVAIGLISYSAYLWHHAIFALARVKSETGHPPMMLMIALTALALGLAYLSWRFIETPWRRGRSINRNGILGIASLSLLALLILGIIGFSSSIHRNFWNFNHADRAGTLTLIEDAKYVGPVDDGNCRFQTPELADAVEKRILTCSKQIGPGILVIGDSHGTNLYEALYQSSDFPFLIGITRGNCRIHKPGLGCSFEKISRMISEHPSMFKMIYYHQAGFHLMRMKNGRKGREAISGVPLSGKIRSSEFIAEAADIRSVQSYLASLSRYTSVAWIGPRLEPHISPNYIVRHGCAASYDIREGQRELYTFLDNEIERHLQGTPVRYISLFKAIGFSPKTDIINCSRWLWRDGDHWSYKGAKFFGDRLVHSGALDQSSD